ncbi:MAG: hypothetical protein KIH01_05550 [Candidatus Freyarchaeota archaeon]|nr:hypothetical protein [Candidatus Jordarchaeia archaeon]
MQLAGIGIALSFGVVALWLFEFGVLGGGGLAVFTFILLMLIAGFPSAFSEAALAPFAPTLPGSLRRLSGRMEVVGWLALVNAVWLAGTLSIVLGLMLATQLLVGFLPAPWLGRAAATQLASLLLWHLSGHRAAGVAAFWATTAALMFAYSTARGKGKIAEGVVLVAAASLVAFVALSVALPGGVNPGVNYVAEGGRWGLSPLMLAVPVLSAGAGMGVIFRNVRSEAGAGFQLVTYPLAVVGAVFLSAMAFFSSGGASGMVDAARWMLVPAVPLDVFSWWLASSATLSMCYGALGGAVSELFVCASTLVAAFGCAAALGSVSAAIREELKVGGWLAFTLSAVPAVALSVLFTLVPLWVHLVFLEWWFVCVTVCVVALAEVLVVGWIIGVKRAFKQFDLNPPLMLQECLNLVFRFAAPAALVAAIIVSVLSSWQQVYVLTPPLTPLIPLLPQDVSSAFTCSSAAWFSASIVAAFTLKAAAKWRRKND